MRIDLMNIEDVYDRCKSDEEQDAASSCTSEADCSVSFEVGKHDLQFACDWAVFPKGSSSSLCYCTSEERAQWIADRLNGKKQNARGDSLPPQEETDGQ